MLINNNIFNEIIYLDVNNKARYNAFYELLMMNYPSHAHIDASDVDEWIEDELNSYPLLGLIKQDSLLYQSINKWNHKFPNLLKLLKIESGDYVFLTKETNYDVVDIDLLQGNGNGNMKSKFIQYLNK